MAFLLLGWTTSFNAVEITNTNGFVCLGLERRRIFQKNQTELVNKKSLGYCLLGQIKNLWSDFSNTIIKHFTDI